MHSITLGSGTPLLLIHGFSVDHRILLSLDPAVAGRGRQWQRVYLDLPGMGASAAGPKINGIQALTDAVVDFIRLRFGAQRFAILGNSLGGLIARQVIAEFGHQVLGLALLCPVVFADHAQRTLPARSVLRTEPTLIASLSLEDAQKYQEATVIESEQTLARFKDFVLPGLRAFDAAAIERISAQYLIETQPEQASEQYVGPTLIVMGKQDHVVGFEDQLELARHYPHATVAILDRAGHNAHLEQPTLTAALIKEWLARIEEVTD